MSWCDVWTRIQTIYFAKKLIHIKMLKHIFQSSSELLSTFGQVWSSMCVWGLALSFDAIFWSCATYGKSSSTYISPNLFEFKSIMYWKRYHAEHNKFFFRSVRTCVEISLVFKNYLRGMIPVLLKLGEQWPIETFVCKFFDFW